MFKKYQLGTNTEDILWILLYIMFMYIIDLYVIGYLLFKDFCEHLPEDEQIPEINFYDEVRFLIILNIIYQ